MNKNTKNIMLSLLGVAAGAGAGLGAAWLIRKQQSRQPRWLVSWQRFLEKQRGTGQAQKMTEAIWQHYTKLLADSQQPNHPALRWHLKEHILPGCALYRVLLEENGGNKPAALTEVDEIFRAWTQERVQKQFGKLLALPVPFRLFKLAAGLQMKAFPADGWEITYLENSDTRLAFNMTRCFYLNTLTALGVPELTASFCKTDEVMAEAFPGPIRFVRPHTLGRGDALCDFQYGYQADPPAGAADRFTTPNQALYHDFAPLYDQLFGATYARARRRAVTLLDPRPGERLLISGVGTGLDLPQIPAGVAVTGVDISPEMLREAAKKSSPANIKLVQMDAQCLDFSSESFDVALLNLIVSVAPDGRAVFQEAWRVLKPGGRLVLFDKFLPEKQAVTLPRAALGHMIRWIGTDINRRLSDILGNVEHGVIEIDEPSLFFGQYRILKITKLPA